MDYKEERKFTEASNVLDWAKDTIEKLESKNLQLQEEIDDLTEEMNSMKLNFSNEIDELKKEITELTFQDK